MLDVSLWGALIAGVLSFFSPCVLPIVPPYLAYLAGVSFEQLSDEEMDDSAAKQILFASIAFVLGFSTVFIALGATANIIGQTIAQYYGVLSSIAGIIIILMGLHFVGILRLSMLYREARVQVNAKPVGLLGAYVMGLAFAFGWTPCVGPVLATILFVAGTEDTAWRGMSLLLAYSVGIGAPFILAGAFAARFIKLAGRLKKHMRKIEIAMGLLLIVTGILFLTGSMSAIAQWLLDTFPAFGTVG
ncbi:cytochrome c biogenesis CcdA family protein [Maritalea porphyrae]|uniref:cytochrome c biogenesis CcdA family protein n=1 Tax=Maritalea porphyrae TaxID=880732 RepID=UPI0022AF8D77|nr:cytochrome c biogenesis protein CcdA [Maritalea porphyrae]MCZ4271225.1 cytochrome c biogenesis protein CcdA [Maritalea porphyrae]